MKMFNEAGQAVYFNRIMKNGKEQFVVKALSGQHIMGRDRQKHSSGRSRNCTRRRRSSGGRGIGARAERFGVIPGGLDLRGFFFCALLFSIGKNFLCVVL